MSRDRRVDDDGIAPIYLLDALLHRPRDGHKLVHAVSRQSVPLTQALERGAKGHASQRPHALTLDVRVIVPQESRWREAIAEMCGPGRRDDPMPESTGEAEHRIIATQVKALKGQGVP